MSSTRARSVYVHAPFCARRCVYCDFAIDVRRDAPTETWLAAIGQELELVEREGVFHLAEPLETLYVGGGTPSLLGASAMTGLRVVLGEERCSVGLVEWTAEANPESLTAEVATAWREAGVTRLSLGVQTFHGPTLEWMGRLHGPEGAERAVGRARDAGFEEISVDLMFGLPERPGRAWSDDLARAISLGVPHVSLYGLTVEPGTPLARAVSEGRERPASEDRYREEYLLARETLESAGYRHYEVSSFALPGREARHNAVYWGGAAYLGLGNGAHSFAPPLRRWNLRGWDAYRAAVGAGSLAVEGHEVLDPTQERLERLWLGLRTVDGVALADVGPKGLAEVERWVASGLAARNDARVSLTAEGWLVLDRLTVELDARRAG